MLSRSVLLAPVILATFAAAAAAQQVLTPEPIDSAAPAALRARAVADLLLAGDRAKIDAYLKEHADSAYSGSANFVTDIDGVLEGVRTGARAIVRLDGLGSVGVGVALAQATGQPPERAILVGMEAAAPHRITRLALVRIQGPGE